MPVNQWRRDRRWFEERETSIRRTFQIEIKEKCSTFLEAQKRQWLAGMPFKNDPSINPIAILYEIIGERFYRFDENMI